MATLSKEQIRQHMKATRSALLEEQWLSRSKVVCDRIEQEVLHPLLQRAQSSGTTLTLLTYIPFKREVNVMPLVYSWWKAGFPVTAPKVMPGSRRLQIHSIQNDQDLQRNRWGILEPREHTPIIDNLGIIDVVLMPGLAYDEQLGRLGYGGGYYDTLLSEQNFPHSARKPLLIAPAFDFQCVDKLPWEAHDVRVDMVISETKFIKL